MIFTNPTLYPRKGMPSNSELIGIFPNHTKSTQLVLQERPNTGVTIVPSDDDADDCLLAQEAWEEIKSGNKLRFVHDGQEVLDYIFHRGPYTNHHSAPCPGIILLGLNMPKKNWHEVIKVIKSNPHLQTISGTVTKSSWPI